MKEEQVHSIDLSGRKKKTCKGQYQETVQMNIQNPKHKQHGTAGMNVHNKERVNWRLQKENMQAWIQKEEQMNETGESNEEGRLLWRETNKDRKCNFKPDTR